MTASSAPLPIGCEYFRTTHGLAAKPKVYQIGIVTGDTLPMDPINGVHEHSQGGSDDEGECNEQSPHPNHVFIS
jgi:hypothetical protein